MSSMRLSIRVGARPVTAAAPADERIALARGGDPEAFRQIFERYLRPVTSFIFDMVNDRATAEELAQETFVRAYRGLANLRDDARLSTWLFGIAKNVAYEALRARRRREMVGIEEIEQMPGDGPRNQPEGELLDKELNGVIQQALAALDEDKRLVFSLKVLQQKSYEEIAAVTGFSIPKLKTDLHRARAEMRRRIGPYLEVES